MRVAVSECPRKDNRLSGTGLAILTLLAGSTLGTTQTLGATVALLTGSTGFALGSTLTGIALERLNPLAKRADGRVKRLGKLVGVLAAEALKPLRTGLALVALVALDLPWLPWLPWSPWSPWLPLSPLSPFRPLSDSFHSWNVPP